MLKITYRIFLKRCSGCQAQCQNSSSMTIVAASTITCLLKRILFLRRSTFHFDCKHSSTNIVCHENCIPRLFPELLVSDSDQTFYFNSSKYEQINVWLGGYHAILHEMKASHYNFLLDELIRRKNQVPKVKLEKDGHLPSYVLDFDRISHHNFIA